MIPKRIQTNTRKETLYMPCAGRIEHRFAIPIFIGKMNLDHDKVAADARQLCELVKHEHDNVSEQYTTFFSKDARKETYQKDWWPLFRHQAKDTYRGLMKEVYDVDVDECLSNAEDHGKKANIHLFGWLNHYNREHYHFPHIHHNSMWSGTYYIKADNDTTPIRFWNPMQQAMMMCAPSDYMFENGNESFNGTQHSYMDWSYFPQTGDVLLWPSWLQHSVDEYGRNKSDNFERISLSFNLAHYSGDFEQDEDTKI